MQIDALNQVILPFSLFVIMYGIGLSLRWQDFAHLVRVPKPVLVGMVGQLLLLPLLAWAVVLGLDIRGELAVGVILIALAPGGATSNLFSYLAKGDVSLSIVLTGLASLVTPITIPVFTALAMQSFMGNETAFSLPLGKTIVQLLSMTIAPVVLGMLTRAWAPVFAARVERWTSILSMVFLALIVALVTFKNRAELPGFFLDAGLATLLLNVMALFIGYQMACRFRLPRAQAITLGFEVGIQNGTLAMVVAGSLIGSGTMMIPAATYSLIMFATAALFGAWLNRNQPAIVAAEA